MRHGPRHESVNGLNTVVNLSATEVRLDLLPHVYHLKPFHGFSWKIYQALKDESLYDFHAADGGSHPGLLPYLEQKALSFLPCYRCH